MLRMRLICSYTTGVRLPHIYIKCVGPLMLNLPLWGSFTVTLQVWGSLTSHYTCDLNYHCVAQSVMGGWLTHIYIISMRLTLELPLWGITLWVWAHSHLNYFCEAHSYATSVWLTQNGATGVRLSHIYVNSLGPLTLRIPMWDWLTFTLHS